MATIPPVLQQSPHMVDAEIWKWAGMASGDVATPVICNYKQDKTVWWLAATPGSSTIVMHGSPDPAQGAATFAPVRDATHLVMVAAAPPSTMTHIQIITSCYAIKPVVAGTGGAGIDVWLYLRGK